jgi:hypothetical protein
VRDRAAHVAAGIEQLGRETEEWPSTTVSRPLPVRAAATPPAQTDGTEVSGCTACPTRPGPLRPGGGRGDRNVPTLSRLRLAANREVVEPRIAR